MPRQRLYYDTRCGQVRTTVFDGSIPLAGQEGTTVHRRAGIAMPKPDGTGYVLHTVDGKIFTCDDEGRPFVTKTAVDAFEEAYVRRQILPLAPDELAGMVGLPDL